MRCLQLPACGIFDISASTRCRALATQPQRMVPQILVLLFAASALLNISCERIPELVDYQNGGYRMNLESAPVIIVGTIAGHAYLGQPHPSHWYPDQPMQLCRVTVRVENVMRGDVAGTIVPVYYLINPRAIGHTRMGMVGRGGHWQIGDRAIFFLQWDSGVLRTVYDTWAAATPPVLSGAHTNYKPMPNESISDQIIDILLDRGQGCDEAQWAQAILGSAPKASNFDLAYTVQKLRQISATYTPKARQAALGELDELTNSRPNLRQG